jgi:hypothetical protein
MDLNVFMGVLLLMGVKKPAYPGGRAGTRWGAWGAQSGVVIVVLSGSQAVLHERDSAKNYPGVLTQRNKLIEDHVLGAQGKKLVFTKDVEFSSPSAAAAVVHGGSANGLIAWKNSQGRTLKELENV